MSAPQQLQLLAQQDAGRARRADPATSKRAALHLRPGGIYAAILDALRGRPEGLTIAELANVTGRKEVSVSPRMKPLRLAGLVRKAGERKNMGGNSAIVWIAC
jgi:hypothetical protein